MSQPPPFVRDYSFTGFSASNPSAQQPGTKLDAQFDGAKQTLDAIMANLALIQRDDGKLANGTVMAESLASSSIDTIVLATLARAAAFTQGITSPAGHGISTLAILKAMSPVDADATILTEGGRAGTFIYRAGNYTAGVAADTLQGIYVPTSLDPTGAAGVWVRHTGNQAARAEWWGAAAGGPDCLAAILAALAVHGNVELDAADYNISAMLVHDKAFTRLAGKGCMYNGVPGNGTRIIVTGGTATCVQVGPTAQPGTINLFPQGIVLEGIHCARGVAPVKGTTAAAVRVQFTLNARLERVRGAESIYGIHVTGNVNLNMIDCYGTRASPGTGAGIDQYRGIYIDGSANIGAAGGNASIWLRRVNASCSTPILDSACIYVDAKYTDCFIIDPETTSGSYGIYVVGLGTATTSTANRDLIIDHPVCDQHTISSIRVSSVNRSGSVEIINPYVGPQPGSTTGLYIDTCLGGVAVRGGQFDMSATNGVPGILIAASTGATVEGTIIHDFTGNAVTASGSANLILKPNLENYNVATSGAGVQLSACNRATVAPMIRGSGNSVATGVQLLGSANTKVDVNVTNIDPGAVPLVMTINAVTIAARGDYTSAGATLAAGTINVAGQF